MNKGEVAVASQEELHAARLSGKRLLALWNALPGVEKQMKVGDLDTLIDQLWSAIEALPDPDQPSDTKRPSTVREDAVGALAFATRAIELGLDWQTIESIVGHKTAGMAFKYTQQRRLARLAIVTLDAARNANPGTAEMGTAADRSGNRPANLPGEGS